MDSIKFKVIHQDGNTRARVGKLTTGKNSIDTPVFMPVGTSASVKAVFHKDIKHTIKANIILANAFHLYSRPGIEVIKKAGGLHSFMNWDGSVLTDSGGYQIFSLGKNVKLQESGVTFQSPIDGTKLFFSPKNVVHTQRVLGSDIIMPLDECAPYPCDYNYSKQSLELTEKWLKESLLEFNNTNPLYGHPQVLFPIIQGGIYEDLRIRATENICTIDSIGYAIGGLSVGEPIELMYSTINTIMPIIPRRKATYLMGVGTPANILECIELGIDMFDCVMPTRNARNGMLFTTKGIINIKNEKWKCNFTPIDEGITNGISDTYTKSYLRHLFSVKEYLAPQIASLHNLSFYAWLTKEVRKNISIMEHLKNGRTLY